MPAMPMRWSRPSPGPPRFDPVLSLPRSFRDAIVAHARRDHPDECCGILPGRDGVVTRVVPMANAERSPTGFTFESGEWLRVNRAMEDAEEELLVVYHSHTMTAGEPSRTDIRLANGTTGPDVHWVLVSTREPDVEEFRSFTIDGTVVNEEEVVLTDG